jgi:hypothetical protein
LNVLNLPDIERELRNIAARTIYTPVRTWFSTVARNYVLNLDGKEEADTEYAVYQVKRPKGGVYTDMPDKDTLPGWAREALENKLPIHFFDPAQPRRRTLWKDIETIADWFNTWAKDDPALERLDRVNFPEARTQALAWKAKVNSNPWSYIRDKPPVYKSYNDGSHWVMLVTEVHMLREANLMGHCVGNATYVDAMKGGTAEFYSLRDAQNNPHVTVEVRLRGHERHVHQMKGKQNAKAVPKYQPKLRDLVTQPGWSVKGDASYLD